jgi:hypothetical protein
MVADLCISIFLILGYVQVFEVEVDIQWVPLADVLLDFSVMTENLQVLMTAKVTEV